ncbi:unnamed protein product [Peniophora sp. CBMAI 1063]|nr:unnamed protein product [Peniophora sp. CBMAI 1063]
MRDAHSGLQSNDRSDPGSVRLCLRPMWTLNGQLLLLSLCGQLVPVAGVVWSIIAALPWEISALWLSRVLSYLPGARSLLYIEFLAISTLWIILVWHGGNWRLPALPRRVLTRAQLHHPMANVFILGVSQKGVLLRIPLHETTGWVLHELQRRHLVPKRSDGTRLGLYMLLSRGDGGLPVRLHPFQQLDLAGMTNNSTIEVRIAVLGGTRTVGLKVHEGDHYFCPGCDTGFRRAGHLASHRMMSKKPNCKPDPAADRRRLEQHTRDKNAAPPQVPLPPQAGPSHADTPPNPLPDGVDHPMDIDQVPPPPPEHMDVDHHHESSAAPLPVDIVLPPAGEEGNQEEDPLGWGDEDEALARRGGWVGSWVVVEEEEEEEEEEEGDDDVDDEMLAEHGGGNGDADVLQHMLSFLGLHDNINNGPPPPSEPLDDEPCPQPDNKLQPPPDDKLQPPPPKDESEPELEEEQQPPPPPPRRRSELYGGRAGEVLNGDEGASEPYAEYEAFLPGNELSPNTCYPFASKMDWDIAEWAKMHSIGSNALMALLKIDTFANILNLQYRTTRQLHKIIDDQLPPRPDFVRHVYQLGGEKLEMYTCDSLEVLRDLYTWPDFASSIVFAPVKHFTVVDTATREIEECGYCDMHTARWWWRIQV